MYYIRYDLFIILNLNWIIDWNLSLSHDVNVGINVTLLRTTNNICQSKHLKNILAAATNQLISIDVYLLLILLNRLLNFFDKFETAIFLCTQAYLGAANYSNVHQESNNYEFMFYKFARQKPKSKTSRSKKAKKRVEALLL